MLWACFKDEVPEALQCLEAALSLAVLCPGSPSTAVRLPLLCVPGCLAPFVRIHSETTSSARQLVSTDAGSRLCKVPVTEGKSHRTGLFPAGGMPAHLSVHVEASLTLLARFLNLRQEENPIIPAGLCLPLSFSTALVQSSCVQRLFGAEA